jgi:hypothetical protein
MLRRQKNKTFRVATQNPKCTCKNLTELSEYSELIIESERLNLWTGCEIINDEHEKNLAFEFNSNPEMLK